MKPRLMAWGAFVCLILALMATQAGAIAPGRTGDFSGAWTGTDWSFPGVNVYPFRSGSAVAISPFWMLTTYHVYGYVGAQMTLNGTVYTVVDVDSPPKDPGRTVYPDLMLMKFDLPLPGWETLYHGDFASQPDAIIIGKGFNGTGHSTYYSWDPNSNPTQAMQWGTNAVDSETRYDYYKNSVLTYSSQVIQMNYNLSDTQYEAGFATGDSGGGTFVKVGDTWELAGINAYVNSTGTNMYNRCYAISIPYYYNWIYTIALLEGDTNHDGTVDVTDLNNVYNTLGMTGSGLLGDTNGDNVVDTIDLNNVYNSLGNSLPTGSSAPSGLGASPGGTVPEPLCAGLLAAGALMVIRRRRMA